MTTEWHPIKDYEFPSEDLADKEIAALSAVWADQREKLTGLNEFTERLIREWAVETGLIERLYTLDRGVTELLIERGLNAALIPHRSSVDAEHTVSMIGDQKDAIESVFSFVKQERELSTSYIKELHSLFTRHQPFTEGRDQFGQRVQVAIESGKFKQLPNNSTRPDGRIHFYCPPEHVASEMDQLVSLHKKHQARNIPPEVEAAWLHHRFVQIHPFADGNGRVARALATLVFIKSGWLPLVVRDERRDEYISALEQADVDKLKPLVSFFASLLRQEFVNALGIAREVAQFQKVDIRIRSIRERLAKRKDALEQERNAASRSADQLHKFAKTRLEKIDQLLQEQLSQSEFITFVDDATDSSSRSHYFRRQIVATAKELGYFANTSAYRSWVRLVIRDGNQGTLLVAFHSIGHEFRGVLACSATWFRRVPVSDEEVETEGETPICREVFQINYMESTKETKARFKNWLEATIERGLALWEATL